MVYLFGRKCEAGWGFNAKNAAFIPNVKINGLKKRPYSYGLNSFTNVFDISRYNLCDWFKLHEYDLIESIINNNQNLYKLMNFVIENHEISGFISNVWCESKKITATKSDNYPPETTHFVDRVNYGLQMLIIFDSKNNHLFENDVNGNFLTKIWKKGQELTKEQKYVVCSVFIFSTNPEKTEMKKMTMNEIVELLNDFENGKHSDLEIPLYYSLTKLTENSYFLDNGIFHPRFKILADQLFEIYWLKKILENKETMPLFFKDNSVFKDIYQKIKNEKDSNFWLEKITNLWNLKIGQCFEILGGSRMTKSALSLDSFLDQINKTIKESQSDLVTEMIDQCGEKVGESKTTESDLSFKQILDQVDKLNKESQTDFFFKKIDQSVQTQREMIQNCEKQTIIMCKTDYHLLNMEMIVRMKMDISFKNGTFEPYVETDNLEKNALLGFASHQNKIKTREVEASELFSVHCPEECTEDDRQWICTNCGQFFKVQHFKVVCDCGITHVANLKFECFDPKHPKTFSFWPDNNSTPVLSRRESSASFSIIPNHNI